jgi:hypothetical protein
MDAIYFVIVTHVASQLQGDFCENKDTAVIKLCLNHSTVLKAV